MDIINRAYQEAKEARTKSYSPYSRFKVGAAIKFTYEDTIYSGCNIENASYGATVCAERSAIFRAISDQGHKEFAFLVLVTDTDPVSVPCALCLQVLAEFCPNDFPIHLANLDGIQKTVKLIDLLPNPFKL